MVPVSIHNTFYNTKEFINEINNGYQQTHKGKNCTFPAALQEYRYRNHCSWWVKALLALSYSDLIPSSFSGLSAWNRKFLNNNKKLADFHGVDNYLQDVLVKKLNKYLLDNDISESIICEDYRDYVQRCIYYHYIPNLDIRWNNISGWGLYAKEDIYPYMFIGLYTGSVMPTSVIGILERLRGFHNKYVWLLSYNNLYSVNAEKHGNHTRFINHDEKKTKRVGTFSLQIAKGNSIFESPHRGFIASENHQSTTPFSFNQGEEIVWDYGPNYQIKN